MTGRDSGDPVMLRFSGALALRDVCTPALAACHGLGLGQTEAARLAILVEELLANLFDHGAIAEDGTIELSLLPEPAGVQVELAHNGPAFDPRVASLTATPARGGGAGLEIVRRWATIRSYEPGPPLNRLRLVVPAAS